MKKTRTMIVVAVVAAIATGCESRNDIEEKPSFGSTIVLNNGNWGGNDACVTLYDPVSGNLSNDAFLSANGRKLGDLAQDVLASGDDVYLSVYGSQIIFVCDNGLKVRHEITASADGNRLSPRNLAYGNGKVYVTYYEGYLGEIDPSAGYEVRIVPVGANPEGLAVAGKRIFVANSGGMDYPDYDRTLSVVDAISFTETARVEVNVNPSKVVSNPDGSRIYVSSFGDYAAVPPMLQTVDPVTLEVKDVPYDHVSSIAGGTDGRLYVLCGGYDADFNQLPGRVYVHDSMNDRPWGTSASDDFSPVEFVTDGTAFPQAYSISATADGYVYIGCSDYRNTGDVYVMTSSGILHDRFDSHGLNPIAVTLCR